MWGRWNLCAGATATALSFLFTASVPSAGFADEELPPATPGNPARTADSSFELDLGGLRFDPLTDFPALPSDGHHLRETGPNFRLIQFDGPTRPEWLRGVRDQGIEVVQYIHPFTYVVWADAARLDAVRGVAGVRWAGELAVEFRVLPHQRGRDGGVVPTMLLVSRHAEEASVRDELAAAGARVHTVTPVTSHTSVVLVEVAGNRYLDLGRIPAVYTVQYIPPETGPRGEMSNQSVVGNFGPPPGHQLFPGYVDWLLDTGYDGGGVIVGIVDGGIRTTHQDLVDRIAPCVPSGDTPTSCTTSNNAHGTHVAGAVAGTGATGITDPAGFLRGQGVAPGASVVQQRYGPFVGGGPGNMQPDGMLKIYRESALSGALLTNNSWGPTGTPQGYDIPTQQVDMITRDADPNTAGHQPVLPVWSIMNGNGDSGGACAPSSLGSPDEAKNLFAVGSTRMQIGVGSQFPNIFDVSPNSGHGPACDGRIVPHVVAPGCNTDSTTSSSDNAHTLACGTSMASPVVSGAVSIFIERYRDLHGADPSPALIKAAFTAVATNLEGFRNADNGIMGHPPDRFQGWGRVDLDAVADPMRNVMFFDQEVVFTEGGQDWSIELIADDPSQPVRLMLIWTDAPGHGLGGTTPAWVNDLDLLVEAGADTYLGNVIGSDGFSTTGGAADERNNMEGVFLRPDQHEGDAFSVTVFAANVSGDALNPHDPGDPSQDFALVCYNCDFGEPTFTLGLSPTSVEMCVPAGGSEEVLVDVAVGVIADYTGTVSLSTAGEPAGVSSELDPDTVVAPGDAVWTLTVDASTAGGSHAITLSGDDGADVHEEDLTLDLDEPLLDGPALVAPADGAVEVDLQPDLTWAALAGVDEYRIEVATDPGFGDVVIDELVLGTTFMPVDSLATNTAYYWRVSGINTCGEGVSSAVFTFTTFLGPPVATISPSVIELEVSAGGSAEEILSLGNLGDSPLVWSITIDVPESFAGLRSHDPTLDEALELEDFTVVSPANGGSPVVLTVPAGLLTRGEVVGFSFVGTASGISGAGSWASDTCLIVEDPDGTTFGVGGFSGTATGCDENDWAFQGSGSDNDGTYASPHDDVFVPAVGDVGDWTFTFINDWDSSSAAPIAWTDVTVTLHKVTLPICDDVTEVGWLSVDPDAGITAPGGTEHVDVLVDATDLSIGDFEAVLCVATNAPSATLVPVPVTLTVTEGVPAPTLTFDASSLDFGDVPVGETSPSQSSTLHNTGDVEATVLVFSEPGGGFDADATTCGSALPAGGSCPVWVTFTPSEAGPAVAVLEVDSDEGAAASLGLAGHGLAEGAGFTAIALEVDPDGLTSDGNRVLEPGELVVVAPAWRNDGTSAQSLEGTAADFTGPDGADYLPLLTAAQYGDVGPGETASCLDGGACYQLGVTDPAVRPATHWEATFEETLSDETTKIWTVHIGESFLDVPKASPFYRSVEKLLHAQVTGGCSDSEYCPTAENTRGQMPVFVLRAHEGGDYTPPACVEGEEAFADVPATSGLCPWIQELSERGVVAGCGGGNYCPDDPVNRQQMAIFLVRTIEGPDYTPPACTGTFADVPCSSPFAAWVEDLFDRGVTGGCGTEPLVYCPTDPVNRQQMAAFVSAAFGLQLYGP